MTALTSDVYVGGVRYAAGTDHATMPAAVVDHIRNPGAWVGGTAPALSVFQAGKARIIGTDLTTATKARAALGIQVDTSRGHLVPTGAAPTAVAQAAAGTSASVAVAGKDTAGELTLTSGSASLATGNQVVVTFNQPYAVAPVVVVSPGGPNASAQAPYVAAATTTGFTVGFGVAPAATTTYRVHYVVVGK